MIIIFVVDTLSRVSLLKVPLENEGGTDIEVSLLCHKKHRRKKRKKKRKRKERDIEIFNFFHCIYNPQRSASIFCRDDDKRTEAERVKRNMWMRGMRVEEIVVEEEEIEVEVEAEARGKSVKVLFPERMTRLVLCNRR
ncbi:hypothetical protein V1477_014670 [Vespula maculifrons]|uniref:Uncharacterized protein n=1 Tax=Vespula maculifrons TaxID=7453 RepID=A0ABD2BI50_VESMC